MKSMKIFTLIMALIAGQYCLLNAQPVISTSPMPANFEIQAHVRNGNSAFEGSLTTPGAPLLQMNPAGDPIWNTNGNQYGNSFPFKFIYTKATGTSQWKIDFNRDGDYTDAEESVAQTDAVLAGKGFRFINVFGQSSAARYIVSLTNLNINGINMGSYTSESDTPFNALFEDATGGFDNITVSGNFSFSGNGGQERPHIWIKLSTPGAKEVFVNDALTGDDSYTTASGSDISGDGSFSAPYASINKAVIMAREGATVFVDAGTFPEQVMVGKNVNITGLDRTKTIVQAPASLASVTWKSSNPIIYVFGSANTVNISKITIDGNNGRSVNSFIGILYYEANGAFTNSRITGIHNAGSYSGDQTGHAYYATHIADATLAQSVSITGNIIDDYQKGGIYVREPGTVATITNNTVTGQNVPAINTQVGIMVMLGASGTINSNIVSNNILNKVEHPHTNMAAGIWLYKAANCTVGTNNMSGNEIGLTSSASTGVTYNPNTFANNKIQVMLDAARDVNPGNIYNKNVKNPLKPSVVFGCIQYSIDEAASGNTLNASAGSYVENLLVHTAVTLNGPNASINPCSGSRVAEAIVYPAVDSPADWSSTLVDLKANNIVIDGISFDGDNPASGGTGNYNVSQGIAGITGQANILIKNNIIKNMATVGIILADDAGTMTSGNSISNNKIDNVSPTSGFGIGIYTGNNTYVNITNNCITNVRKGIQGGENNYIANAGNVSPVWSGNAITSYKIGIWNNLAYGTATPVTITGNTVNTMSGSAINSGILISSIGQNARVNVSGNTVTGAMAGINLWNNPTNTPLAIGANTYINCDYGIFANNFDGYTSNAGSSSYLINGGTITNPLLAGIYVKDNNLNTNNATVSVSIAGTSISGTAPGMKAFLLDGKDASLGFSGTAPQATVTGAPKYFVLQSNGIDVPVSNIDATQLLLDGSYGSVMSLPALFASEDKIDHKIDDPALGFVNVKANNLFVTTNSYIAPATTRPLLQRAIDFASAGFTVNVAEGTYAENMIVNKSLAILGPKATVSGCDLSRGTGEAIVVPGVNDVNGEVFHVTSSDVTIKGFTIDGDNPSLPANGYGFNGADMHAAEGVTVYVDNVKNLNVENNIFKNLLYYGVTLYGASFSAPATSGHSIKNNKFQDLGTYDPASTMDKWGGGILLYNNQYASVTGNCMTNVRTGIQTGNFHALNPGDSVYQVFDNNTIQARRRGIFYNLHYGTPSPLTFSNNTITALANTNETRWIGFAFSSLSDAIGVGKNNTINGIGLTIPSVGYEIWNVKNNAPASITGGSVSNVSDGVFANNFEGYASNGGDGAHATLSNIIISPTANGTGIHLHDNPASTHAEVKVTIGSGVTISGGNKGVNIDGAGTNAAIANATITANAYGISVLNGGKLTNCANNFITNNTKDGISVEATAGAIGSISENDLSGNGLKAVNNLSVPAITATCNWWGSAVDVVSKFAGNVTYYPWLFDGTDNALPISGFQPVPNSCLNPPVCSINSPVNNFVSSDNASIIIQAQASEPGGNITKVELFLDAVKTGELTTEPYNFTISNPVLGNHVLSVKASDAYGVYTFSSPVNITVKCSRYDLNNNNSVEVNDYLVFLGKFGSYCNGCQEDFNNDGKVDVNDYLLYLGKFGYTCN
jgi:hypothetical protein